MKQLKMKLENEKEEEYVTKHTGSKFIRIYAGKGIHRVWEEFIRAGYGSKRCSIKDFQ